MICDLHRSPQQLRISTVFLLDNKSQSGCWQQVLTTGSARSPQGPCTSGDPQMTVPTGGQNSTSSHGEYPLVGPVQNGQYQSSVGYGVHE